MLCHFFPHILLGKLGKFTYLTNIHSFGKFAWYEDCICKCIYEYICKLLTGFAQPENQESRV